MGSENSRATNRKLVFKTHFNGKFVEMAESCPNDSKFPVWLQFCLPSLFRSHIVAAKFP